MITITYEQWLETVDKWVKICADYENATGFDHPCGLCQAVKPWEGNRKEGVRVRCRDLCPAYPEACEHANSLFLQLMDARWEKEDASELALALRILEWLHDFGKLAEWTY